MKKAWVKEWFENKLANQLGLPRLYHLDIFCGIKETEKAVYAMFYTGFSGHSRYANHKCGWIPKSCIENIEALTFYNEYNDAVDAFNLTYIA